MPRQLRGRVRPWLAYPVVVVALCAATAGGFETVQEGLDRGRHPMHGELVDVGGGRRMHLSCAGSGTPTVILVPGAGEPSSVWGWIAPAVARDTRVCVYDRAGRGWSDPSPGRQDGVALATDLKEVLARAHEPPPYVLVGHSFGGLYVRAFAARYPSLTGGMVLLDATHPRMFSRVPGYPAFYETYRRVSTLFPALARFGVARLAYRSQYDGLPSDARAEQVMFWSTARHARSQHDEWEMAPLAMCQADSLVILGDRPLVVVTALRDAQEGWEGLQDDLVELSTDSNHWLAAEATHMSLVVDKDGAAFSARAIQAVVGAVRTALPPGQPRARVQSRNEPTCNPSAHR